jgi:hypothetical protein
VIVFEYLWPLVVTLGVLIFVHEAGHFIAAKWAGIYVHRFSLGLGSPIPWLTRKIGETEYSISWLPLGGYVQDGDRGGRGRQLGARGWCVGDRAHTARPDVRGQTGLEADGGHSWPASP